MEKKLILSHNSEDKAKAQILSNTICRITLNQISVWHSSDDSPDGGLKPGHVWLDEIRKELGRSRAIVILLTPKSIKTPWVLFESGFGAANHDCDVIPVCVGIDNLSDVPFPLAMYQAYQLSDYSSLKRFIEKLLKKYDIVFDEEMVRPILSETIQNIVQDESNDEKKQQLKMIKKTSIDDAVVEIKKHLDHRLVGLLSSGLISSGNRIESEGWYSVEIAINFKDIQTTQFLEIGGETSVQDVLDNLYAMLKGKVDPYSYLDKWILRDADSNIKLILNEVGNWIPAKYIFTKTRKWELLDLKQPYNPDESKDTSRWYRK